MKTPSGKECRHYYQDFHRGRSIQECRLAKSNPTSERWQPNDCNRCPVPDILRANADPDMVLTLTIKKRFLGFRRELEVTAKNALDGTSIENPYIGKVDSGNIGLEIFRKALEEDENQ